MAMAIIEIPRYGLYHIQLAAITISDRLIEKVRLKLTVPRETTSCRIGTLSTETEMKHAMLTVFGPKKHKRREMENKRDK